MEINFPSHNTKDILSAVMIFVMNQNKYNDSTKERKTCATNPSPPPSIINICSSTENFRGALNDMWSTG